jgi:hypothetical protein
MAVIASASVPRQRAKLQSSDMKYVFGIDIFGVSCVMYLVCSRNWAGGLLTDNIQGQQRLQQAQAQCQPREPEGGGSGRAALSSKFVVCCLCNEARKLFAGPLIHTRLLFV